MTNTASLTLYRPFEDPADTIAERNRKLVQSIAVALFNRRLERLASAPGSVLLGGSMSVSEVEDAALTTRVSLAAKDGEWPSALAAAEQEVRRARLHGFTAPELKEVMTNFMTAFETAAAQADTRRNQALADGDRRDHRRPRFRHDPGVAAGALQGVRAERDARPGQRRIPHAVERQRTGRVRQRQGARRHRRSARRGLRQERGGGDPSARRPKRHRLRL